MQSLIFEMDASPSDKVHLTVDGERAMFSIRDALQKSRVLALMDDARATIKTQFGLAPDDIENPDVVWHNAYKVKIHTAIPESGYATTFDFVDGSPPPGRNWYRLRVSQLNGQMAWSSPIWFEALKE